MLGKIGISVTTLDYERDRKIMESVLHSVESTVHMKDMFVIGEPKYAIPNNLLEEFIQAFRQKSR